MSKWPIIEVKDKRELSKYEQKCHIVTDFDIQTRKSVPKNSSFSILNPFRSPRITWALISTDDDVHITRGCKFENVDAHDVYSAFCDIELYVKQIPNQIEHYKLLEFMESLFQKSSNPEDAIDIYIRDCVRIVAIKEHMLTSNPTNFICEYIKQQFLQYGIEVQTKITWQGASSPLRHSINNVQVEAPVPGAQRELSVNLTGILSPNDQRLPLISATKPDLSTLISNVKRVVESQLTSEDALKKIMLSYEKFCSSTKNEIDHVLSRYGYSLEGFNMTRPEGLPSPSAHVEIKDLVQVQLSDSEHPLDVNYVAQLYLNDTDGSSDSPQGIYAYALKCLSIPKGESWDFIREVKALIKSLLQMHFQGQAFIDLVDTFVLAPLQSGEEGDGKKSIDKCLWQKLNYDYKKELAKFGYSSKLLIISPNSKITDYIKNPSPIILNEGKYRLSSDEEVSVDISVDGKIVNLEPLRGMISFASNIQQEFSSKVAHIARNFIQKLDGYQFDVGLPLQIDSKAFSWHQELEDEITDKLNSQAGLDIKSVSVKPRPSTHWRFLKQLQTGGRHSFSFQNFSPSVYNKIAGLNINASYRVERPLIISESSDSEKQEIRQPYRRFMESNLSEYGLAQAHESIKGTILNELQQILDNIPKEEIRAILLYGTSKTPLSEEGSRYQQKYENICEHIKNQIKADYGLNLSLRIIVTSTDIHGLDKSNSEHVTDMIKNQLNIERDSQIQRTLILEEKYQKHLRELDPETASDKEKQVLEDLKAELDENKQRAGLPKNQYNLAMLADSDGRFVAIPDIDTKN